MALYAFDGTWNENKPGDKNDTNVYKFYRAYGKGANPAVRKWYVEGPGTRWGWIGKVFGGIGGAGGSVRVDEAYKALKKNFQAKDTKIDIVGFSRGAALALDFANRIHDDGVAGVEKPEIRFLGLWDTVASFGIPGNPTNLGFKLGLPGNVRLCCHALALDERRQNFDPERLASDAKKALGEGRVAEVWFRGMHSDIGGGNGKQGLPSIALHWMYLQAQRAGLPITKAVIDAARGLMKADEKLYKNLDPIENKARSIRGSDIVHVTVQHRNDSGDQHFNNPPKGMGVVDDSGRVLAKGFMA